MPRLRVLWCNERLQLIAREVISAEGGAPAPPSRIRAGAGFRTFGEGAVGAHAEGLPCGSPKTMCQALSGPPLW